MAKKKIVFEPAYLKLYQENELKRRVDEAFKRLKSCFLCPRRCGVNRLEGEKGFCRTGKLPIVSSYHPHFGEESLLVGTHGSGTIFFAYCNLGCLYCQNYTISHLGEGEEVSFEELAQMMLYLQKLGCHNINFVTPTHVVPQILAALLIAVEGGLNVPFVYNTGGYDAVETLKLLDGVFDIYMPDLKYTDAEVAGKFSRAKDYPEIAKGAIKEMHRQVGNLVIDESGLAIRGLLVRHLVLPEGLAGTREAMRFLAKEISSNTYVNLMDQYHPCYKAYELPPLSRCITAEEYMEALKITREEGLSRFDKPFYLRLF